MKQIITSIIVTGILLKVLLNTADPLTKIIVLPFLIFAIGLGLKNVLILMKKNTWAVKVGKVYVIAFLTYWFGF